MRVSAKSMHTRGVRPQPTSLVARRCSRSRPAGRPSASSRPRSRCHRRGGAACGAARPGGAPEPEPTEPEVALPPFERVSRPRRLGGDPLETWIRAHTDWRGRGDCGGRFVRAGVGGHDVIVVDYGRSGATHDGHRWVGSVTRHRWSTHRPRTGCGISTRLPRRRVRAKADGVAEGHAQEAPPVGHGAPRRSMPRSVDVAVGSTRSTACGARPSGMENARMRTWPRAGAGSSCCPSR
jgi:hypothetical protein